MTRVDELLALLPAAKLRLVMIQEKPGDPNARWYACVAEAEFGPDASLWDGWGPDPLYALTMALTRAGCAVGDEMGEDGTYLTDLAERLFKLGTPATGTDDGDVSRLREIAAKL